MAASGSGPEIASARCAALMSGAPRVASEFVSSSSVGVIVVGGVVVAPDEQDDDETAKLLRCAPTRLLNVARRRSISSL